MEICKMALKKKKKKAKVGKNSSNQKSVLKGFKWDKTADHLTETFQELIEEGDDYFSKHKKVAGGRMRKAIKELQVITKQLRKVSLEYRSEI
jgi:hypothetical protein